MTLKELETLQIGDEIEFYNSASWNFRGTVRKIVKDYGFFINMTWGSCGIFDKTWLDKNIITRLEPVKIIKRALHKFPKSESFKNKNMETITTEIRHGKI